MAHLHEIADCNAQAINGGFGGSRFSFMSYKSATTNLGQINTANNFGIGAGLGIGVATSEQVNFASIATLIG